MFIYREKILYADEDDLFCEGLLRDFKLQNSFEVVDIASDWVEVLAKTEKLEPDIVVMNIRRVHSEWIGAAGSIRRKFPSTTIVVLCDCRQNAKEALRAGVNALIAKNVPFSDVLRIIGSVTETSAVIFPNGNGAKSEKSQGDERKNLLSKRENEILALLTKGFQSKEIAYGLSISLPTVNNHLYSMFRKLGCSNRTEAVVEAVRNGWVAVGA
jgi:two-component system, NarL family, response regulator DegU